MNPRDIGQTYDAFAPIWDEKHGNSDHGVALVARALVHCARRERALDVGCGAGGRMIRLLASAGFSVTGIDVSVEMIRRARGKHPEHLILLEDISTWNAPARFDFIVAWESLWHLRMAKQRPVLDKLCGLLRPGGVLFFTHIGHVCPDETKDERWTETVSRQTHFSSLGLDANIEALAANRLELLNASPFRYPVYLVARKPA